MLLPSTTQSALLLLALGFVCLGSWACLFKASRWRYELFYLDFAIGAVVLAVAAAYSLGMLGSDMSFMDRTVVAGLRSQAVALAAGFTFGLGNLLLLAGVALGGMSIAFPLAFSAAFLTAELIHAGNGSGGGLHVAVVALLFALSGAAMVIAAARSTRTVAAAPRRQRAAATADYGPLKLISVCLIGGVLIGGAEPLGNSAFWGDLGLGAYAGALFTTIGLLAATVFFDIFFMNMGLVGGRVTLPSYTQAKVKQHGLGLLAGVLWAGGMLAMLLGRSVADLPAWSIWLECGWVLLAAFWGLSVWNEATKGARAVRLPISLGLVSFAGAITAAFLIPAR